VSPLSSRCEGDLASGRTVRGDVVTLRGLPERPRDLWELSTQPPFALVPIGRLQAALLKKAIAAGVTVRYECDVTRVRRHARFASFVCADGTSVRAAMIVLATGAARSLLSSLSTTASVMSGQSARMIGGLYDLSGAVGRWIRVEFPVPGLSEAARCTILQAPSQTSSGTAVLVAPQVAGTPTDEQLQHAYYLAARAHGLEGAPELLAPMVFDTSVTTMTRRYLAGDGRAPIVIAGDAAQTGHVFSGQTCFVNLALVLVLGEHLRKARAALYARRVNDAALVNALAHYNEESAIGAAILARISQRHYEKHQAGAWAHAGIARQD
jgi:2-polyprenyl-6-methoxyphenol hydroxylase-like FAD-dependent oxidoreductase